MSTYDATLSRCSRVISGPMSHPRRPSPIFKVAIRSRIFSISGSATESTARMTLTAMQRSPAEPKPALTAESATRSRSASGSTSMWFLAPPSAWTRLPWAVPVS